MTTPHAPLPASLVEELVSLLAEALSADLTQVLSCLEETYLLEFMVKALRRYVDFQATTREEEDEYRYRVPLHYWWLLPTDGFKRGRPVVEKEPQTLPKVKRWLSQSLAPMSAVICAEHPGWQASLEKQIIVSVRRWKDKHRRLLKREKPSSSNTDAGVHAGAPLQGAEGCRKTPPCFFIRHDYVAHG